MNKYIIKSIMGIGDWGLGPIPNPQSPIPNPQSPYYSLKLSEYMYLNKVFYISKIKNKYK